MLGLLLLATSLLGALGPAGPTPVDAQAAGQPQVDVVFAMDTSGSMDDESQALCEQITQLIGELQKRGLIVQYRILNITPQVDFTSGLSCATDSVQMSIPGATVMNNEDWGPAVRDLAIGYPWQPQHVRLVIPISDAGPYQGEPCEDPGPDRTAIQQAILAAQSNKVRVAPILGSGHESEVCNADLADALARSTGGRVFLSTTPASDLARGIEEIIGDVANDQDGDGLPDDKDSAPQDPCQPNPQAVCLPQQACGISNTPHWDDDQDGRTDEELPNGQDDDGDGLIDEDVGGPNCPFPRQDCGVNSHRNFDDDSDQKKDEEIDNNQDDDGDGYIDEDVTCACPPAQTETLYDNGIDDDHDRAVDEELPNQSDDDGDGCIDEDVGGTAKVTLIYPLPGTGLPSGVPLGKVRGTAQPNSQVTVLVNDTPIATIRADAQGNWETLDSPALHCGINRVRAEAARPGQTPAKSPEADVLLRPAPPGPYIGANADWRASPSFQRGDPLIATYYYYWFDENDPTNHHVQGLKDKLAVTGANPYPGNPNPLSYKLPAWHEYELRDMITAGVDVVLPVTWGVPCQDSGAMAWSNEGLTQLVLAAQSLLQQGLKPPRIGMMYDTTALDQPSGYVKQGGTPLDMTTLAGKERFYLAIRDFYSLVPPELWAQIDGRPIVWLFDRQAVSAYDASSFEYVREQFKNDFQGRTPFIVMKDDWQCETVPGSCQDEVYQGGAAQFGYMPGNGTVASLGPGIDERGLPGSLGREKDRLDGALYIEAWETVLAQQYPPYIVVLETWNELETSTAIGHTLRYGLKYVDITAQYAIRFKSEQVPFRGLPAYGEPIPKFWHFPDLEERILDAINGRRQELGRSPVVFTPGAQVSAADSALNNLQVKVPSLQNDGYRLFHRQYWLRNWTLRTNNPAVRAFPTRKEIDELADFYISLVNTAGAIDRTFGSRVTGAGIQLVLAEDGNYGLAVVLDYTPRAKPAARRSSKNDTDFGQLQPGDILVATSTEHIGAMSVTWAGLLSYGALWAHAGIYVGDDMVVEAGVPGGVQMSSLEQSSFWSAENAAIYRVRTDATTRQSAAGLARQMVGKPYNFNFFKKHRTTAYYCSQAPWAAYYQASGQQIDLDQNLGTPWWLDTGGLVTPDDLTMNSHVDFVSGDVDFTLLDWRFFSPVTAFITDPKGRRAGINPSTGKILDEIPGAIFDMKSEPKFIAVPGAVPGDYLLTLTGTGDGPYKVETRAVSPLIRASQEISSTIATGQRIVYRTSAPAPGRSTQLVVEETSTLAALRIRWLWPQIALGLALMALLAGSVAVGLVFRSSARRTRAMLLVRSGPGPVASVALHSRPVGIGRAAHNDLVLPEDLVSRAHARVVRQKNGYIIEDLASTTGTFVNHQRVTRAVLRDGDEIGIGKTLLVFHAPIRGE
jgi:uncharacterized protein YycO